MPAEGGEARKLSCNTSRMNSWHSWSPNSKWLVFSSKQNSAYTQLFLTHIDEKGNSSPAVLLSQFTASDRAANIPEFVNIPSDGIKKISEQFVDENSYLRTALEHMRTNDYANAEIACQKAMKINPNNWEVQFEMAVIRDGQGKKDEALSYCKEAVRLNPKNGNAQSMYGFLLWNSGNKEEGMAHLTEGINLDSSNSNSHVRIGQALLDQGKIDEGREHLIKAASLKPDYRTLRQVADIMLQKGQIDFAVEHYLKAINVEPSDYISLNNVASVSAQQGKVKEAAEYYRRAININPNSVQSLVGLAKILVSKKTEFRDVEEAIQLSSKACEVTHNQEMQPLLLLAAANAEGGHYQDAVKAAYIALELANSSGDKNLPGIIQKNIEFYKMSESKQK